jgi:hypothetical protein
MIGDLPEGRAFTTREHSLMNDLCIMSVGWTIFEMRDFVAKLGEVPRAESNVEFHEDGPFFATLTVTAMGPDAQCVLTRSLKRQPKDRHE